MKRNKLLLLLALLMTAATGAWAQTETLLTTITPTGKGTYSETTTGVVTVTHDNSDFYGQYGWVWWSNPGSVTVVANEGYTITKCVFYQDGKTIATISTSPFKVNYIYNGEFERYICEGTNPDAGIKDGVSSIEVFGAAPAAPAGFTVSMKDGVKDADKWTVKVGEGQAQALPIGGLKGDGSETVTLQYNGRLKVKGVKATSDAAPAKTPATVTTAPTGAAIVGVGKTTALVSGGVADGGTLMYAVTTTNTKPTSTDGFSDAVPTAQTITASGKVYVWYFVKADDTHTDSEIAATAIEVPVADIVWDVTNVSELRVSGTYRSYTMEGVTLSGISDNLTARWYDFDNPEMDGIAFEIYDSGGYTFTAPTGKNFTKIEMTLNGSGGWDVASLGTGWAFNWDFDTYIPTVTWTGSAASTVDLLKGADEFNGAYAKSIAFYLSE